MTLEDIYFVSQIIAAVPAYIASLETLNVQL